MADWVEQLAGSVHAAARAAARPEPEADRAFDGDARVWAGVAPEGERRVRAMRRAHRDAFGEYVSLRLLASADLAGHPEVAWTEAYPAPRVSVASLERRAEVEAVAAELAGRLREAWSEARRNARRLEQVKERHSTATSSLRRLATEFTLDES